MSESTDFQPKDRGPTSDYAITWRNGHVDHVHAHQVSWDDGFSFMSGFMGSQEPPKPKRVKFHAEIDGHWTLLLDTLEEDIVSIRNVTQVPDAV